MGSNKDPARARRPGQGLMEYGIILALASMVAIIGFYAFTPSVASLLSYIKTQVSI
jgi:Flp pilus assembly pilin Flp